MKLKCQHNHNQSNPLDLLKITARNSTLLNSDAVSHKETMHLPLQSTPIAAEMLDLARAFHRCRLTGTFAVPAVISVEFNGGHVVSLWLATSILGIVLLRAVFNISHTGM